MSFIRRQSYKKKLEFACLSSFFLPVAQHSLHATGKELLALGVGETEGEVAD